MTIITALYNKKNMWLGHNDALTIGDTPILESLNPWLFWGEWGFGITGESLQQNVLSRHLGKLAEDTPNAVIIVERIREVLLEHGYSKHIDESAIPSFGIWGILVHKKGKIWDVGSRLDLTEIPDNQLWARGSGADFALGADKALSDLGLTTEQRVQKATDSAIKCDVYCPGETNIIHFTNKGEIPT